MVRIIVKLYCDSCDEPYDALGRVDTAAEARDAASRDGWVRKGRRDLCRACATAAVTAA